METLLYLIAQAEKAITTLKGYIQGTIATENAKEPYIAVLGDIIEEKKEELTVSITYNEKELKLMSREFKKEYKEHGCVLHVRKKGNSYEIRYRKSNANLSASSTSLSEAKDKMHDLILQFEKNRKNKPQKTEEKPSCPLAVDYAMKWAITVKKPILTPNSYRKGYELYIKNYISPFFGKRTLEEISFTDLQSFINGYIGEEKFRTAKGLRLVLREIFTSAHADGIISTNPSQRLKPITYEQEHGIALSVEKEKEIADKIKASTLPRKNALLACLFSGMRPCELSSVEVKDGFFVIVSAKQRKGTKSRTRLCPITPQAMKYVDLSKPIQEKSVKGLWNELQTIEPNITTYDFRHTFITRAQECGVPQEVVQVWVGHKSGKGLTGKVYTHYSEEYHLKEAQKVNY